MKLGAYRLAKKCLTSRQLQPKNISRQLSSYEPLQHLSNDGRAEAGGSGSVGTTYAADSTPNLFHLYKNQETNKINIGYLLASMEKSGILRTDPRLDCFMENLQVLHQQIGDEGTLPENINVGLEDFHKLVGENIILMSQALSRKLVIPEFTEFCSHLKGIFQRCAKNKGGKVASYIPQLARYSPDNWAMSICTVDGQRYALGKVDTSFTMQSCSKPFSYAISLNELGPKVVHSYVSHEPSGRNFNEICLDSRRKPHNPLLNSGAIMLSAVALNLLHPEMRLAEKFDYLLEYFKRIAGDEYVGFNNSVFLSERETADRNFAMAYFMRENKCFPPGFNLQDTMDLYFQSCSMEVNANTLAVMGATLANGGLCPTTGEKVFNGDCVRNVLSLMFSCGMYNYSGEFAFKVGLPAKSGVSGALIVVVPNVMGIGLWSPALDEIGNSVRGLQFCQELTEIFNFHRFDNIRHTDKKLNPRRSLYEVKGINIVSLLFAAKAGDLSALQREESKGVQVVSLLYASQAGDLEALKRMYMQEIDMDECDYDGRTALHVAAAEGHLHVVKFLLEIVGVQIAPKDRWGFTPAAEAERFGREDVLHFLRDHQPKGKMVVN